MCACVRVMTSQPKNVSSKGRRGRNRGSVTGTEAAGVGAGDVAGAGTGDVAGGEGTGDVAGGVGTGVVGLDAGKPTKNTRRRSGNGNSFHQKRTRNTNRPKSTPEEKQKVTVVSTKPVLESTNPFFIAVCAPDSYRPSSASGSSSSLMNNDWERVDRDRDRAGSRHRRLPNVFLRSNCRNSSSGGGGGGMINHFIHHPIIQNDRRKAGNFSSISSEVSKSGVTTGTTGCVIEIEQFPALSSGTVSTPSVQTKLNFKEMMLKSATSSSGSGGSSVSASNVVSEAPGSGSGSGSGTGSTAPSFPVPKVRAEYAAQQTPQKALSSGNIFLAAFYDSRDNEYYDEDDIDDDNGGGSDGYGGGGGVISSALIDSCDRKYDRLYH